MKTILSGCCCKKINKRNAQLDTTFSTSPIYPGESTQKIYCNERYEQRAGSRLLAAPFSHMSVGNEQFSLLARTEGRFVFIDNSCEKEDAARVKCSGIVKFLGTGHVGRKCA